MKDFTLKNYTSFLNQLLINSYRFQVYSDYRNDSHKKEIILRHDVDSLPENSLKIAQIENTLGIKGTYYFRIVPQSNEPKIIEKIVSLGHEIGYHYEDLALCKGHMDEAIKSFEKNLNYFRQFGPVKTICMHGSPLSRYDNKKLWEKYDYRDFGVIGEPYFDVDFSKVLYLTDTGRRWDGEVYSVRDKVINLSAKSPKSAKSSKSEDSDQKTRRPEDLEMSAKSSKSAQSIQEDNQTDQQTRRPEDQKTILTHNFHSTEDIIKAAKKGKLPDQLMITVHPQRWTNNPVMWMKELVWQNMKNQVKRALVGRRL
jgi:hypothetical protein